MSVITNECDCHIALTIEKQLKKYSECPGHTDRHEILWHEWNHNKRWLARIHELILPSFPNYSMHDTSHAESVLYNIELLLGEETISQLSATDCFVILHTVYIHDIGMCITCEERQGMVKNGDFIRYLEQQRDSGDAIMKHYAEILLQECFVNQESPGERKKHILGKKLDVYYAIIYMMAEFRREKHGDVSAQRLREWITEPDKLGAGFSTLEMPSRLFYIIADCANTHTKWDFGEVMKLRQEDTGFAHDYVHPRFAAVLLQLGDALDMDNGRFHPLIKEFMGKLPETSEIHYEKHRAIRRLRITNEKISIIADCESQSVLRQIRRECDAIREILKNASGCWSVIRPKELNIGLPTFNEAELLLNGKEIPEELVEAGFNISQEKAFNLLKGNNIYQNEKFVFLRELLQNAVDATKFQYFRDCRMQWKRVHGKAVDSPVDAAKLISPGQYPIEIEFAIARYKDGKAEVLEDDNLDHIQEQLSEHDCGVLVKIRDNGIGISAEDVAKIADVGTSYENREEEIAKMPLWLQPTGTFGIGLQSVFLVADRLMAHTYSRKDSPYEITFYPQQGAKRGYINVVPAEEPEEEIQYGTCFELFVPNDKKRLHAEDPKTWDGLDPFGEEYDRRREIRHGIELMKQMALYLTEIIGEPLFPITIILKTKCVAEGRRFFYFSNAFKNNFFNAGLKLVIDGEEEKTQEEREKAEREGKKRETGRTEDDAESVLSTSWIYHIDSGREEDAVWNDGKNIFRLDCRKAKLYIWNHEHRAFACLGIRRILEMRKQINNSQEENPRQGANIFYKGIRVTERFFPGDANLLEYIDLKKTLEKDQLKLDRNGFSDSGDRYLVEVYKAVVASARKALKYFGKSKADEPKVSDKIINSIVKLLSRKKEQEDSGGSKESDQKDNSNQNGKTDEKSGLDKSCREAEEVILSAAALAYFAMIDETDDFFDAAGKEEDTVWNELVKNMISLFRSVWDGGPKEGAECEEIKQRINAIRESSTLYGIRVRTYFDTRGKTGSGSIKKVGTDNSYASILDIVDASRKYAVVSVRDKKGRFWKEFLVELPEGVHADIKGKVKELRKTDNLRERRKIMSALYEMARPLLEMAGKDDDSEIGKMRKEGIILKWVLDNVPTMALFSSEDGNIRVNVLDREVCRSVYYDEEMRVLTIEKMRNQYMRSNICRFSTAVWSGYGYLGIEKLRASIQPVKRGKISDIGSCSLIVPLSGEQLENLYRMTEEQLDVLKSETFAIYENLIKPTLDYVEKGTRDNPEEIYTTNLAAPIFWTKLLEKLNKPEESEALETNEKLTEKQCDELIKLLQVPLNVGMVKETGETGKKNTSESGEPTAEEQGGLESNMEEVLSSSLTRLRKVWEERENGVEEAFPEWYQKVSKSRGYQRMLEYTAENAVRKLSQKQVEALYFNYIFEMQDAIRLTMERNLLKDFPKNFRDALINKTWMKQASGDGVNGV